MSQADMDGTASATERINRAKGFLFAVVLVIAFVIGILGWLVLSQVWPAQPMKVYSSSVAPYTKEACVFDRDVAVILDYRISRGYEIRHIEFTQEFYEVGQKGQTFPGGALGLDHAKNEIPPSGRSKAEAPYTAVAPTTPGEFKLKTTVDITYDMMGIPRTDTFHYATAGNVTVKPSLHCRGD